jgi:hypothetical protein
VVGQGRAAVLLGRPPHGAAAAGDQCGFDATEVDSEGIDHLNGRDPDGSLDPSAGCGCRRAAHDHGREALDRLFQSAGVVGFQDRDGVWRVKYLEIPAAAAEIVTRRVDAGAGQPGAGGPSLAGAVVDLEGAYDRNCTPMTAADLAGGDQAETLVDPNIRAFSLRATAYAQATTRPSPRSTRRSASARWRPTLRRDRRRAARRPAAGLYGGGQALYRAKWEGVMGKIEFMDAVTVKVPRLGMRNGRTFLVVGLTEDAPDRQTETILWGGGAASVARPVPSVRLAAAPATVAVSATAVVVAGSGWRSSAVATGTPWCAGAWAGSPRRTCRPGSRAAHGPGRRGLGHGAGRLRPAGAGRRQGRHASRSAPLKRLRRRLAALGVVHGCLANTAPTPAAFISSGFGPVMPSAAATVTARATVSLSGAGRLAGHRDLDGDRPRLGRRGRAALGHGHDPGRPDLGRDQRSPSPRRCWRATRRRR